MKKIINIYLNEVSGAQINSINSIKSIKLNLNFKNNLKQ
jgi:hypothetical protein